MYFFENEVFFNPFSVEISFLRKLLTMFSASYFY